MPAIATGAADRSAEQSALVIVVDGLIDRAQRSPLMRRAPAQCTPEEQATLAQVLADLALLRRLRTSLDALPPLRLDQVSEYWPELGSLLVSARRAGAAGRARPRDPSSESEPPAPLDASPAEPLAAPEAVPAPAPPDEQPPEGQDAAAANLARLLAEALADQGRALNTTQMLTWLGERGVKATREQITDTLFRHEDLFRRRGTSQWVMAGRE